MNNWTLKIKITVIVGVITALSCIGITVNSIISADSYYGAYLNHVLDQADSPQDIEMLPDNGEYVVDSDSSPDYQMVYRRFSTQGLYVMVLIVLLSSAVTYYVMGSALNPLNRLVHSIREIRYDKLNERIRLPESRDEIWQLTHSFNDMLGRLEEDFVLKTQFAANAAHELKTPLAIMKTSLQVLEMDEQPSETDYREFMNDIGEGLERLIRIVDHLLALTREEEDMDSEEIDLDVLLKEIAEDLREKAEEKQITITISADRSTVCSNKILLNRLVYNLAENSVKYNKQGGEIRLSVITENGRTGVKVSDTGSGMDQKTLKHVFEPFYRADGSRSQKIPGSGLGLSIVKLIAERMDGELQITSTPGNGTTVCFFFSENA